MDKGNVVCIHNGKLFSHKKGKKSKEEVSVAVHTSTAGGVGSGNPLVRELRPHMPGGGLVVSVVSESV